MIVRKRRKLKDTTEAKAKRSASAKRAKRYSGPKFAFTLPLKACKWEKDMVFKKINGYRQMYNHTTFVISKLYHAMCLSLLEDQGTTITDSVLKSMKGQFDKAKRDCIEKYKGQTYTKQEFASLLESEGFNAKEIEKAILCFAKEKFKEKKLELIKAQKNLNKKSAISNKMSNKTGGSILEKTEEEEEYEEFLESLEEDEDPTTDSDPDLKEALSEPDVWVTTDKVYTGAEKKTAKENARKAREELQRIKDDYVTFLKSHGLPTGNKNSINTTPPAEFRIKHPHLYYNLPGNVVDTILARVECAQKKVFYQDGMNFNYYRKDLRKSYPARKGSDLAIERDAKNPQKFVLSVRFGHHISKEREKQGEKQEEFLKLPIVAVTPYDFEVLNRLETGVFQEHRILRKQVGKELKLFVQVVVNGEPPKKPQKLGKGVVGIDIGTQTTGFHSDTVTRLVELADTLYPQEKEFVFIKRALDRSRRMTNVTNYKPDKEGRKGRGDVADRKDRKGWIKSRYYRELQRLLRSNERKRARKRELAHFLLAKEIVALGDTFVIEKVNWKGLQRRAKKTEKNSKGKFKKKKRFGKSLGEKAPASFEQILKRKVEQAGGKFIYVNTQAYRASQYNHVTDTYTKRDLSTRWVNIGGHVVQRDMYSAFLLKNFKNEVSPDRKKCEEDFDDFLTRHNAEVTRLNQLKLTKVLKSSMGMNHIPSAMELELARLEGSVEEEVLDRIESSLARAEETYGEEIPEEVLEEIFNPKLSIEEISGIAAD